MATINPFMALRPTKEKAGKIAALPYDVYTREEAKREVKKNPLSFLAVDRAETTLPDDVGTYEDKVYLRARDNLEALKDKGYLIKEEEPSFYLYELTEGDHSQTGLVATCLVDEYLNKTIKEHEATRKEKEKDRIKHVKTTSAHTGPIYLTYKHNDNLTDYINSLKNEVLYDITTEDGVRHRVYKISDRNHIDKLKDRFSEIENFYIADGHHRCASAVKVAEELRENNSPGEYDNFLSVIFPDDDLKILDYNRVVKDLNGFSNKEFLERIKEKYTVEESDIPVSPDQKGTFGMYLGDKWFKLSLKEDIPEDTLEALDVSIIYDTVLNPILGIGDPRVDKRIDFIGGIKGLGELEKRVNKGEAVAFSLYPTKLTELMAIADSGRLMPPKSTWFEPKLRSGLFIHEF